MPELTRLVIPERRTPSYNLLSLTSGLPRKGDEGRASAERESESTRADGPFTVGQLLDRIKTGQDWHNAMIRLVARWVGRGWSTQEILLAAEAFTLPDVRNVRSLMS